MSCDQSAWQAAAANFETAMSVVKEACEAVDQSNADVANAQAALQAAQAAAAEAATAYQAAKSQASTAQTNVAVESEKLGIICQCPEEPA